MKWEKKLTQRIWNEKEKLILFFCTNWNIFNKILDFTFQRFRIWCEKLLQFRFGCRSSHSVLLFFLFNSFIIFRELCNKSCVSLLFHSWCALIKKILATNKRRKNYTKKTHTMEHGKSNFGVVKWNLVEHCLALLNYYRWSTFFSSFSLTITVWALQWQSEQIKESKPSPFDQFKLHSFDFFRLHYSNALFSIGSYTTTKTPKQ